MRVRRLLGLIVVLTLSLFLTACFPIGPGHMGPGGMMRGAVGVHSEDIDIHAGGTVAQLIEADMELAEGFRTLLPG